MIPLVYPLAYCPECGSRYIVFHVTITYNPGPGDIYVEPEVITDIDTKVSCSACDWTGLRGELTT